MSMANDELLIGLVSISDRASSGVYEDAGIPALKEWFGAALASRWRMETRLIPDEQPVIEATLRELVDTAKCHLVLTTGGTGPAPRDVTPEATLEVLERLSPGVDQALRADALERFPHGMLSRGVSGTRRRTFVVNLPGSPKACAEGLQVLAPVLEHAVSLLRSEPTAHPKQARS